ncbi:hypothetical protein SSS_06962 [Sarcoptes scabiei]|nr:hypothetical protein SSS_06962 [Sarcoptes scabiei]
MKTKININVENVENRFNRSQTFNQMNGFTSNPKSKSTDLELNSMTSDKISDKTFKHHLKMNSKDFELLASAKLKGKRRLTKISDKITSTDQSSRKKISNESLTSMNSYYDPSKKTRDPFDLIDYQKFQNGTSQPFIVKIKLDALALMDLHAHCFHTEVIGCLGGFYCKVTRTLHILAAEPCYSIENHETECEMDPVSQALVLEKLERKNLQMVGWYHSHPTFSPKPSVRDIDTQNYYQKIFKNPPRSKAKNTNQIDLSENFDSSESLQNEFSGLKDSVHESDSHPFVAFIISPFIPYDGRVSTLTSKSFTRFQAIIDRPIDAKFYANNRIYSYHHAYNKSFCYFTPELNNILSSSIKCFWVADSKIKTHLKQRNLLVPYEMEINLIRDENFIPSISNGLSEMCLWLLQNYSLNESMVKLFKRYTRIGSINVTYLEKVHYDCFTILSLAESIRSTSLYRIRMRKSTNGMRFDSNERIG